MNCEKSRILRVPTLSVDILPLGNEVIFICHVRYHSERLYPLNW